MAEGGVNVASKKAMWKRVLSRQKNANLDKQILREIFKYK